MYLLTLLLLAPLALSTAHPTPLDPETHSLSPRSNPHILHEAAQQPLFSPSFTAPTEGTIHMLSELQHAIDLTFTILPPYSSSHNLEFSAAVENDKKMEGRKLDTSTVKGVVDGLVKTVLKKKDEYPYAGGESGKGGLDFEWIAARTEFDFGLGLDADGGVWKGRISEDYQVENGNGNGARDAYGEMLIEVGMVGPKVGNGRQGVDREELEFLMGMLGKTILAIWEEMARFGREEEVGGLRLRTQVGGVGVGCRIVFGER